MAMTCTDADAPAMRGQLIERSTARDFALAGNARFTIVSTATGVRFTYKVRAAKNDHPGTPVVRWFVSVLTGSDNEADYTYLGTVERLPTTVVFRHGRKSPIGPAAPSAMAFKWAWNVLTRDGAPEALPDGFEIWHEGRCGRCARVLTVPSSIASGFGPECINKI